jgi:hypothetical protein
MLARIDFEKSVLFRKSEHQEEFLYFKRDVDTRKRKTMEVKKELTIDICSPKIIINDTTTTTTTANKFSLMLLCHQKEGTKSEVIRVGEVMKLHPTKVTRDVPFNIPLARGKIRNREFMFVGLDHNSNTVMRVEWKVPTSSAYYSGFFKVLSRNTKGDAVSKSVEQGVNTLSDKLWTQLVKVALEPVEEDAVQQPVFAEPNAKRQKMATMEYPMMPYPMFFPPYMYMPNQICNFVPVPSPYFTESIDKFNPFGEEKDLNLLHNDAAAVTTTQLEAEQQSSVTSILQDEEYDIWKSLELLDDSLIMGTAALPTTTTTTETTIEREDHTHTNKFECTSSAVHDLEMQDFILGRELGDDSLNAFLFMNNDDQTKFMLSSKNVIDGFLI